MHALVPSTNFQRFLRRPKLGCCGRQSAGPAADHQHIAVDLLGGAATTSGLPAPSQGRRSGTIHAGFDLVRQARWGLGLPSDRHQASRSRLPCRKLPDSGRLPERALWRTDMFSGRKSGKRIVSPGTALESSRPFEAEGELVGRSAAMCGVLQAPLAKVLQC